MCALVAHAEKACPRCDLMIKGNMRLHVCCPRRLSGIRENGRLLCNVAISAEPTSFWKFWQNDHKKLQEAKNTHIRETCPVTLRNRVDNAANIPDRPGGRRLC